jgi:hypothetical protein
VKLQSLIIPIGILMLFQSMLKNGDEIYFIDYRIDYHLEKKKLNSK